jgi:hypothetical protein
MTDPLSDLATITGMAKQSLMFFSRNNSVSYGQIKTFFLVNSRMPTIVECTQIKANQNE